MSEWISLKDRLPEIDQWVLVFFPKNHFYGDLILSLRFYYHNWTEKGEIKRMAMFSNIDTLAKSRLC